MSFADFKKSRQKYSEKLNEKLEALDSNPFEDDRFWKMTVDKAKNGSAEIRWLPGKDGEDIPFVRIFSHSFQGPGGWYIDNCPTTEGQDGKQVGKCPTCADNKVLWNSGIEENIALVSGVPGKQGRKRKLSYISNILVIKDPANPENNGKIFLFKYGAKIFEKIQEARTPAGADEDSINPFDMWEGATFYLKSKNVGGFQNYDSSKFGKVAQLDKSEKKMEEIYNSLYSLQEFIGPDKFKSEADLTARFNRVIGNSQKVEAPKETAPEPERKTRTARPEPVAPSEDDNPPFDIGVQEVSEDEPNLEAFRRLAED